MVYLWSNYGLYMYNLWIIYIYILVGGWATSLKNMRQLGWLFPIYGKIKMFQTTNQSSINYQLIRGWSPFLLDNHHAISGKTNDISTGPFSIAMSNNQRVYHVIPTNHRMTIYVISWYIYWPRYIPIIHH